MTVVLGGGKWREVGERYLPTATARAPASRAENFTIFAEIMLMVVMIVVVALRESRYVIEENLAVSFCVFSSVTEMCCEKG